MLLLLCLKNHINGRSFRWPVGSRQRGGNRCRRRRTARNRALCWYAVYLEI